MPRRADSIDVLVVGAGPAGSMAARATAAAGHETLLVERRTTMGTPVRCGELAPAFLRGLPPDVEVPVVQTVSELVLHLPEGETARIAAPGVVMDRDRFDQALARSACRAGAELALGCPLVRLERGGVAHLGGIEPRVVRARVVIGADGPRSTVSRFVGLGSPAVMLALQRRVDLARPVARAHLVFWTACRHGYGWLFPKGGVANAGVAVPRGAGRLGRALLTGLLERLVRGGLVRPADAGAGPSTRDRTSGGLVPSGGPLARLYAGRVVLAGDAAGQTDPLSGAGIAAAVTAGAMAGEAVASALASGRRERAGPEYELAWRRALGLAAARSMEKRREMEALWDRDVERAVRRAWLPAYERGMEHDDSAP
jgi:geranylgeranyl reductase family protein